MTIAVKSFNSMFAIMQQQVRTLQSVVASLQQDVASLEIKMEDVEERARLLVAGTCPDDVDEGGAERAEMEWEEQEHQKNFPRYGNCRACDHKDVKVSDTGLCEGCFYEQLYPL